MYVKKISLKNYRNYEEEKAEFINGTNIIYGKNAQGKTNLLESIYLFSSGKSHRRAADTELIKKGSDFLKVSIVFHSSDRDYNSEISITSKKKKLIKLNGVPLKKTSELLGVFKCVIFSPEELNLIKGAPEKRRNFLDMSLSSIKPGYYGVLKKYYKILKQKNSLLKKIREDASFCGTMSVWNEELAEAAARIMMYRHEFLSVLSPAAACEHMDISQGAESLSIKYSPNTPVEDFCDKEHIKSKILNNIIRKREAETAMGMSLVGIHRDDIDFLINNEEAKVYSSQGQQRTAVISVKIALTEIIKEAFGEYPVLLLDDVMSELDSHRREFLYTKTKDKQVIIVCTDKDFIKEDNIKYFKIENGQIFYPEDF